MPTAGAVAAAVRLYRTKSLNKINLTTGWGKKLLNVFIMQRKLPCFFFSLSLCVEHDEWACGCKCRIGIFTDLHSSHMYVHIRKALVPIAKWYVNRQSSWAFESERETWKFWWIMTRKLLKLKVNMKMWHLIL